MTDENHLNQIDSSINQSKLPGIGSITRKPKFHTHRAINEILKLLRSNALTDFPNTEYGTFSRRWTKEMIKESNL